MGVQHVSKVGQVSWFVFEKC